MSALAQTRIIVALDYPAADRALALADQLDPRHCRLKVGKELFTRAGPSLVRQLCERGFDVFLDLKYHDIPNTVAAACEAAAELGVWMLNVHASGGLAMMRAARERLAQARQPPLLIAVTLLTSLDAEDLAAIGCPGTTLERVERLALLAAKAGLDGVVCSPREARALRQRQGPRFLLVTPGVRPAQAASGDQKRVMTPSQAVAAGADHLVIGRPITAAPNPRAALAAIQAELAAAPLAPQLLPHTEISTGAVSRSNQPHDRRTSMAKINKAVFPVAGLGTRFLPVTKASPKEMLPVVDKPLIQYAAEEAEQAGATQLVFVTGRHKRSIEDHFDKAPELEAELEAAGKDKLLHIVRTILPEQVSCIYLRQPEALGLGHAVLCAKPVVGNEPFAILLADDLINNAGQGVCAQMAELHERTGASILSVEEVPANETHKYGIVETEEQPDGSLRVTSIVEKPRPEDAPSNLAVVGRYLLTPTIFDKLEQTQAGAGGEIQLTDAIAALLNEETVIAHRFAGKRYDCGSKEGYLEATVELALQHPELGASFRAYLQALAV